MKELWKGIAITSIWLSLTVMFVASIVYKVNDDFTLVVVFVFIATLVIKGA